MRCRVPEGHPRPRPSSSHLPLRRETRSTAATDVAYRPAPPGPGQAGSETPKSSCRRPKCRRSRAVAPCPSDEPRVMVRCLSAPREGSRTDRASQLDGTGTDESVPMGSCDPVLASLRFDAKDDPKEPSAALRGEQPPFRPTTVRGTVSLREGAWVTPSRHLQDRRAGYASSHLRHPQVLRPRAGELRPRADSCRLSWEHEVVPNPTQDRGACRAP